MYDYHGFGVVAYETGPMGGNTIRQILEIGGLITFGDIDFDFRVGFARLLYGVYVGVVHIREKGGGKGDSSVKRKLVTNFLKNYFSQFGKHFPRRT